MINLETQVLIIGCGVTGAGVARDLSLRGISCIVVEAKDVNTGASGSNHGLLHSGARYVAHDGETAAECYRESRILRRMAPQCIEDTGGLFVAVPGDDCGYIADFPNLCSTSGIPVLPIDPADAIEIEPTLNPAIISAWQTPDAVIDPFKLSLENIFHAVQLGTILMCFTRVTGFSIRNHCIQSVDLNNSLTGEVFRVYANQIVSATGAWAGEISALAGIHLPMIYSKGTLTITHQRMASRVINRLRLPSDGDIVVPGGTVSIAGTTSTRVPDLRHLQSSIEDVDTVIRETAVMLPELRHTRYIRAFSGVRPLTGAIGNHSERNISRGTILIDHALDGIENMITITGGKLTTYRLMAEQTADLVCSRLNIDRPCQTKTEPLPQQDACQWSEPGLSPRYWMKTRKPGDLILCECEMVPMSAIDCILKAMNQQAVLPGLRSLGVRSRLGKGPCQGAYCSIRTIAYLYDQGVLKSNQGLMEMTAFLRERWKGMRPVLWGEQLKHAELQEAIHCGLFEMELQNMDTKIESIRS
ncbi:MAG: anaerobic glycerol-3-phosphate dehydrogenase subunit A [Desulfatirhabdiaceae bacterium]